ncbi:MAG TPA: cupin domain-containing protein [Vicinamibacterales bacterium]|nr:cupin domain-containing protein [Vicinamibacterales bacterium]
MATRPWSVRGRLSLAAALLFVAAAAGAAQQDAQRGQGGGAAAGGRGNFAANFTGTVAIQPTEGTNMSRIRFEAGARTNWHVHTAPQILLIEEGRGRWQEQGDAVKELPMGQPVLTKANVPHWHGAAPDQAALQFSVYAGKLEWQKPVTDAEYKGR